MKPPYALSDEPCMSDQTLLVSVEDLINLAMGPQEGNVIDFKIIQTILHILARQMRLLEQKVVLEVGELPAHKKKPDSSSSQSTSDDSKKQKGRKREIDVIVEEAEGKGKRHSADRGKSGERDHDAGRGQAGGRDTDGDRGQEGGREQGGKDRGGKGQGGMDQGGKDQGVKAQGGKDQGGKAQGGKDQGGKDQGGKAQGGKDQGGKDQGAKGQGGKGQGGKDQGGKGSAGGRDQEGGKGSGGKGQEVGRGQDGSKSPRGIDGKSKEQAKAGRKEEEELAREGGKGKKGGERDGDTDRPGKTGIHVKDGTGPDKEKVLVVEKGPTTRGSAADSRSRSIEVVTQSQFALLEAAVATLREQAGPLPPLTLPDNEQLRSDLARGTASLTDTMQAMQVSARVQAAEQAVSRLGGLLTQLAAAGAIPEDAVARAAAVTFGEDGEGGAEGIEAGASKSTSFHPSTKDKTGAEMGRRQSRASSRQSSVSQASARAVPVTQPEMADALACLRDDLTKEAQQLIFKATNASEGAVNTAKAVSEKLDVAVKLNGRITNLYAIVNDYADQLSGFDAGLTTQMQSFQEQMVQMRSDLRGGLTQLENANSNAETAAVMELTERYELLVGDLEHTMQSHQALTGCQQQLAADLRSLVACVEMLREQKADRDEVSDGLRDKADNTRLAGLLRQEAFEEARQELERRLEVCHDKFHRQENVWMKAVKDLGDLAQTKAELMELLKMRDESAAQLQNLHDKVKKLELVLGEPKAAVLTRQLGRGALCAACLVPALMDPADAVSGKPPKLPRALPEPVSEPCEKEWKPDVPPDLRTHTCRRWVGGSHTLLTFASRAQAADAPALGLPTKKYTGVGNDGRLYWFESEMEPCVECNPQELGAAPGTPATPEEGAGDGKNKDSRRRTMTAPAAVDPAASK